MIWMLLLWNQKQQSPPAPETADARATDDKPLYSDFLLPPSVFFFLLSSERGKKEKKQKKRNAQPRPSVWIGVVSFRFACVRACVRFERKCASPSSSSSMASALRRQLFQGFCLWKLLALSLSLALSHETLICCVQRCLLPLFSSSFFVDHEKAKGEIKFRISRGCWCRKDVLGFPRAEIPRSP